MSIGVPDGRTSPMRIAALCAVRASSRPIRRDFVNPKGRFAYFGGGVPALTQNDEKNPAQAI